MKDLYYKSEVLYFFLFKPVGFTCVHTIIGIALRKRKYLLAFLLHTFCMQKICITCGVIFNIKPSRYNLRINCSKKCLSEYLKHNLKGKNNPNYRDLPSKICQVCGAEYSSYQKNSKYCSHFCYSKSRRGKNYVADFKARVSIPIKFKKEYKCITCKIEVKKNRKYCKVCSPKGKKNIDKICQLCGKKFQSYALGKYCSKECYHKTFSGDGNPNYIDGRKSVNSKIRQSKQYKEWRTKVFKRDNYTCMMCGQFAGMLHAHHIKPFCNFPEQRFDVANGLTLCIKCHKTPGLHNWSLTNNYKKLKQ